MLKITCRGQDADPSGHAASSASPFRSQGVPKPASLRSRRLDALTLTGEFQHPASVLSERSVGIFVSVELCAVAGESVEDFFGGFVPDEWFGVFVPVVDPGSDVGCESVDGVV